MIGRHVLIVGVELVDRQSMAVDIADEFRRSKDWSVQQIWYQLGQPRVPKFVLINQILESVKHPELFDYVVICDDDVDLPEDFLDSYLRIVEKHSFALAQPARTSRSPIHHPIVEQVRGLEARRTRFVEIGPVVSINQTLLPLVTPFDEATPMGWGFDYTWPLVVEDAGLRMGIVDATPVSHVMRPPLSEYSGAGDEMTAYLAMNPHLEPHEAYRTLEEYHA